MTLEENLWRYSHDGYKWVYIGDSDKLIHGQAYDIFEYHWGGPDKKITKYINCDVSRCIYIIDSTLDEVWSKDFKTLEEVRQEKLNDILNRE